LRAEPKEPAPWVETRARRGRPPSQSQHRVGHARTIARVNGASQLEWWARGGTPQSVSPMHSP
jgi:hypothetical protein